MVNNNTEFSTFLGNIHPSFCYNSVLQDMEFFDNHKNSVGALTARLATDASAVQGVRNLQNL